MSPRPQAPERRKVAYLNDDAIIIPFKFLNLPLSRIDELDPLDSGGHLMKIATGEYPPREPRPHEPMTAWETLAHRGLIEEGAPPLRSDKPGHLNREQRLEAAREVLSEAELLLVESIAVPKRYRTIPARELDEMIRTAPDYIDRMWAGCWLTLIWTESPDCTFRDLSEMPPNMCGEMEETIVEAYAATIGVTSRADVVGWRRVDDSYETNLISHRLAVCEGHYAINGPPPYEQMKDTLPLGPGWTQVVRIVPEKPQ
jgi:hypothetical protein